jgi:hypothetical protein
VICCASSLDRSGNTSTFNMLKARRKGIRQKPVAQTKQDNSRKLPAKSCLIEENQLIRYGGLVTHCKMLLSVLRHAFGDVRKRTPPFGPGRQSREEITDTVTACDLHSSFEIGVRSLRFIIAVLLSSVLAGPTNDPCRASLLLKLRTPECTAGLLIQSPVAGGFASGRLLVVHRHVAERIRSVARPVVLSSKTYVAIPPLVAVAERSRGEDPPSRFDPHGCRAAGLQLF